MVAVALTACLDGVDASVVTVEADIADGLPNFTIVGLTDRAVQEARERVRPAIKNSSFPFPSNRVTVNLAPAGVRKEGSAFDLAIAVAVLRAAGRDLDHADSAGFLGELGLDGGVRPIRGAMALGARLRDAGARCLFVPRPNAEEALTCGLPVYAAETLAEVVDHLEGRTSLPCAAAGPPPPPQAPAFDMSEIEGQEIPKRALEIAAAGGHHLLLIGPPGAGKTMLARALAGLLPDLSGDEAIEVTRVHSVAGALREPGLITRPPTRSPHHTVSPAGLLGGGTFAPGEASLAHRGVLILDELPEFRRDCLEGLREPLEEGVVRVSRAAGSRVLPARFTLVATANPCPCGAGAVTGTRSLSAAGASCQCQPDVVARYQRRISGPLRDRIDLVVPVGAIVIRGLGRGGGDDSTAVRARVKCARDAQAARQGEGRTNAALRSGELEATCRLDPRAADLVPRVAELHRLSGRGFHGALRLARTIADLDGRDLIGPDDILEACEYRAA